jgi:hypothetical protein
VVVELERLLGEVGAHISEAGTASERLTLHEVAEAARWVAPGASAALVDWDGTETARLRAFGVLHGVAVSTMMPEDQLWLLDRLTGSGGRGRRHRGQVA